MSRGGSCKDVGELGDKVEGEVIHVVIGDGRRGGVEEAELGVEGWVMVDGVDECGELGVCGDRLLEEGEVGDVDSEIGEVGWEVGRVVEASFEGVGKAFEVGCGWSAKFSCHACHNQIDCDCCHSKNRVGDQSTIRSTNGLEEYGGEFRHSSLMGVEFLELSIVRGDDRVGGVVGGNDWKRPCGLWANGQRWTDDDVGGVCCPLN